MTRIFCKKDSKGKDNFYAEVNGNTYYLFSQKAKYGVEKYYQRGVDINKAIKHSGISDCAIHRTMDKLPIYIKYVEREFDIIILRNTMRKKKAVA